MLLSLSISNTRSSACTLFLKQLRSLDCSKCFLAFQYTDHWACEIHLTLSCRASRVSSLVCELHQKVCPEDRFQSLLSLLALGFGRLRAGDRFFPNSADKGNWILEAVPHCQMYAEFPC